MRWTPSVATWLRPGTIATAFLACAAPSFGATNGAPLHTQVGSGDFASAVVIPSLPFTDTGNTCVWLTPGEYTVRWDGTNVAGQRVASGIYMVTLDTSRGRDTRKATLAK